LERKSSIKKRKSNKYGYVPLSEWRPYKYDQYMVAICATNT
jgi:hypothetical protein